MPKSTKAMLLASEPEKLHITVELTFEQPLTDADRLHVGENIIGRLTEWAGMGALTPEDPLENDNALDSWDAWSD